jgi:hypothetical protein
MGATYSVPATADIALTAATAKTIISIINAANSLIRITELSVSFDGTSGTAEPVTVELCSSTQAGAGTAGSTPTPAQTSGATRTVQASGALNYSAEPTTLTVLKTWLVHPQTGIVLQSPLGRETQQNTTADALCLRCTAPANVNCRGYLEFEEG